METIKYLPKIDQQMALIYLISGVLFLVFSYIIYYCESIPNSIRFSILILKFSLGFIFLTRAGDIVKGKEYSLDTLIQWSIIFCTLIGFWVVTELIKWNKKKRKENDTDIPSTD